MSSAPAAWVWASWNNPAGGRSAHHLIPPDQPTVAFCGRPVGREGYEVRPYKLSGFCCQKCIDKAVKFRRYGYVGAPPEEEGHHDQ